MSDLISRTTRGRSRDLMAGSTLGQIGAAFQDELFAPNPDSTYQDSSSRRTLTQEYLEAVDWTDINQVNRALRVFERLIQGFEPQYTSRLLNSLRRDGYTIDEETGHIAPSAHASRQPPSRTSPTPLPSVSNSDESSMRSSTTQPSR